MNYLDDNKLLNRVDLESKDEVTEYKGRSEQVFYQSTYQVDLFFLNYSVGCQRIADQCEHDDLDIAIGDDLIKRELLGLLINHTENIYRYYKGYILLDLGV